MMKKNDFILAGMILALAGVGLLLYTWLGHQGAGVVTVSVDGKVFGTYSLYEERRVEIDKSNVFIIQDGQVDMTEADCPDQICVEHKAISKNQETIVCLPNRVIVEVIGGEEAEMDSVSE